MTPLPVMPAPLGKKADSRLFHCSHDDAAIQKRIEIFAAGFWNQGAGIAGRQIERIPALAVAEAAHRVAGADARRLYRLAENAGEHVGSALPHQAAERSFRVAAGRIDKDSRHVFALVGFPAIYDFLQGGNPVAAFKAELFDQQMRNGMQQQILFRDFPGMSSPKERLCMVFVQQGRPLLDFRVRRFPSVDGLIVKFNEDVVEMELDSGNLDYRCLLLYGWGKNATFAFRELDRMFLKIKSMTHKQRVALLRLQYGVDMDDKTRECYRKYVSRSVKNILRMCMEEGRMDWVKVCEEAGVLRKDVVEYAIAQAAEAKKAEFAAFFLEYQRTHFPPKEEKCDDRLRLPDLPKEKKEKKPLDKNSKGYIKKVWKCEELEDGTLCLLRYYGEDTEVTVPDSIDGKRISTIGSRAFSPNQGHITDAQKEIRKNITSVSLGSGIREIGKEAFCVCEKLGKVCFAAPEPALETGEAPGEIGAERSRVAIGEYAFWRCKSLTSVIGSENIASLEKGAFVSCSELKDIRLAPETRVAELAFWGCASLDMVICGDGGKTLLFCSPSCAVGNVVLPEGIERIGGYAFEDCKQLTGIQLPASLKYINDYAFRCCERLERIIFCGKPESVAEHAFEWDNALKTLESPHDLKKIECLTVALKKSFVRWHVRLIQRDVSDFSKGAAPLPNMVVVG